MRLVDSYRQQPDTTDWRPAESHALEAALLSPNDYRPRVQLGWIREDKADWAGAEEAARAAVRLAPSESETHYELGTVLLGRGNMAESAKEFRAAVAASPESLATVLGLIWRNTHGNLEALRASTPDEPQHRLTLARFLLDQSLPFESAAVIKDCDPSALLQLNGMHDYIDGLISAGSVDLAYEIWSRLRPSRQGDLRNGGFESDILVDFAQFDWSIQPSKYAVVAIDPSIAHSGTRSLRIDYLNQETTRLENEIQQTVLLQSGARYRVHYYVRTQDLTAASGPRVAVTPKGSNEWIASSDPAPEGSSDWAEDSFEFTAPDNVLVVSIKQRPKFSYEPPTHGVVWFDDFEIQEIH
jgi:tetratricopeptide (TPR) repeat protein